MPDELRRQRLKQLARGLPPNPKRHFHPVKALDGDLLEAAKAFAREAVHHGRRGDWWPVWRAIQQELKRPLSVSIADLSREQLRWLAVWLLHAKELTDGVAVYRAFLAAPGTMGPFASENVLFLDALVATEPVEEVMSAADGLGSDPLDFPDEQCHVALALIDAGRADDALLRIAPVLVRHHAAGSVWAVKALALSAAGRELEARRATVEAAKCRLYDEALIRRLVGSVLPATRWSDLSRRYAYQPEDVEEQRNAWSSNPGADLVPGPDAPHGFGGDMWRTSPCKGCGHPIRVWFTLDMDAIPELHPLLPGWRFFPLLGCADCMVWMGRHDYRVDADRREVELLNVAISTDSFGEAFDTTPPIPFQPAGLRWRQPGIDPDDHEETPQVGGVPRWTQGAERVFCLACRNEMRFIASMAAPTGFTPGIVINNESGFQYHFACAACRHLSVIAQWT